MKNLKGYTKKILSVLILLTIIINLLPNFGLLAKNVYAVETKGIVIKPGLSEFKEIDGNKIYKLDVYLKNITTGIWYLKLEYDSNKMIPACIEDEYTEDVIVKTAKKAEQAVVFTDEDNLFELETSMNRELVNGNDGKGYIFFGGINISDEVSAEGELLICTVNFIVKDTNLNIEDIASTDFNIINTNGTRINITEMDGDVFADEHPEYFSLNDFPGTPAPTVQSLSIKTNPTQGQNYMPDEEIDLTGGELTATYTDGSTKDISMLDENVTVKTGEKAGAFADIDNPKLTFEYEDCTIDLAIAVVDTIEKIEFYDKNNVISSRDFDEGTPIPTSTLYIKAIKKSGAMEEIKLDDSRISLDSDIADANKIIDPVDMGGLYCGIQKIEITYTDEFVTKTTNFSILVNDRVGSIKISETNSPKTEYIVNDNFEKTGAITVIGESGHNYGDIEMSSGNVTVTEMDGTAVDLSKTTTDKELKVSFGGKETSYTINIGNTVKSIKANGIAVGEYKKALTADSFQNITITEIMADGKEGQTLPLDFAWVDVSSFINAIATKQDLTVNYPYNGSTIEGKVSAKVKDELLGIRVENLETDYVYQDELNYEEAILYLEFVGYDVGCNLSDFDLEDEESELKVTGFDSTKIEENQELTFTYNDGEKTVTTTSTVNIGKATPKYTVPTGLEGYEGKAVSSIDLSKYPGFAWADSTEKLKAGSDNKYKTTMIYTPDDTEHYKVVENIDVEVSVIPKEIENIEVTTAPSKTSYIEGQDFDPTGMVITVNYNDGDTDTITEKYTEAGVTFNPSENLQTSVNEIEVTYRTKTATTPINVEADYVTGIKVIDPKNSQSYGKTINLANVKIQKTWASELSHGADDTQDVTLSMISSDAIDSTGKITDVGTITVTVKYTNEKSEELTATFDIEVEDVITSITMNDIDTEYYIGDEIDSNLAITINYVQTPSKTIKITDSEWNSSWVTGIDMSKAGTQNLTIAYGDDASLYPTKEITVKDYIGKIQVTSKKSIYKLNESVDFSGIKVQKYWKSNEIIAGSLSSTEYTLSPATIDTSVVTGAPIEVTVSYKNEKNETLTDKFYIQVINSITDAELYTEPTNMPEKYGDSLDLLGASIKVQKQDGFEIINLPNASVTVSAYNSKTLNKQEISFVYTYTELDENGIEQTIAIPVEGKLIIELQDYWTGNIKVNSYPTKCIIGNDMDLSNATVSKVMASGALSQTSPVDGSMISGFNKNEEGKQTVTVTHWDKTATFDITVVDELIGISMNTLPEKLEYTQGEDIDVTGGKINVTKSSGTQEIVITKEMISGYDPEKAGQQVITVTYGGKITEFVISVKARTTDKPVNPSKPTTPTKPSTPSKPSNNEPSASDTITYTVTFVNYDGEVLKTQTVAKGESATAPVAGEREGYRFLGWDKEFDVVEEDLMVIAKYEEIKTAKVNVSGTIKVEKDQELDLSNITMDIFDEEGNKIDEIQVTKDMISGFNSSKVGLQDVTITYIDENGVKYTTTFKVRVEKPVETLGVKDEVTTEKSDVKDTLLPALAGIGISGLLLLLIAVITKKNVEIYAVSEEERKLIGKERISKKNTTILLEQYKSKISENESIELEISDKTVEKLKDEQIKIVTNDKTQRSKVKSIIKVKK